MVTLAIDLYRSATTHPAVIGAGRWSLRLAMCLLARALNMPEPLLHSTGAFVFAQVQATEARAAKPSARSACCASFGRDARRRADRSIIHPHEKENCHDKSILVSSPRPACRRHLQRRIGSVADLGRKRAGVLA
jgi:hypothetical protein